MKWITALDLEQWASSIPARTLFPGLVADLIRASVSGITSFRFPTGDKGQVRGFDGSLVTDTSSTYVPEGRSIWEFGVSKGAAVKAESDYVKRVSELPEDERASITFVFVSLQSWDNPKLKLDDWIHGKKSLNEWADVRYIDGVCLESWLDDCPAVASRYSRYELGKYLAVGARSTDEFWEEYSNRFEPALSEEVLLSGREKQAEQLLPKLVGGAGAIRLASDSPDEVIAFAVAAIRKSKPDERFFLEARTLIVDTEEAARSLARENLIFLPRAQAGMMAGLLARLSPTLVASGGDQPKRNFEVLERPSCSSMGEAFTSMGFTSDEGYEQARSCGRSVTILSRLIPAGTVPKPEWLGQGMDLIPALLAGGWLETSEPDKGILARLASVHEYGEFESKLRSLTKLQDPPIDRVQDVWKLRASVDAFVYLGHLIGTDDLSRLKEAVTLVFSRTEDVSPKPEDLYQLSKGNPGGYSDWLRDGLATTLLQIAVLHDQADLIVSGSSPQQYVNDLIEGLPGLSSDCRLLLSLENQLPLLAEAAPDPLLFALERLLEGDEMIQFFDEKEGALSSNSKHVYVLWALEVIAWNPLSLRRVSLILAKLANIDPGGRLSNRPINSLREIFIPWSPNTNANENERTDALALIVKHEPDVAWDLLVKIFPRGSDTSSPTMRPRYREFGASEREVLTYAKVWESQRNIVNLALGLAKDSSDRLVDVIDAMSGFGPDLIISSVDVIDLYLFRANGEAFRNVWVALRDEANRNRRFKTADWALSTEELKRVDDIVKKHQPSELYEQVSWLFDDWNPSIRGVLESTDEEVEKERRQAVNSLIVAQGVGGVIDLVRRVKLPQFVASSVIGVVNDVGFIKELIGDKSDASGALEPFFYMVSGLAAQKFKGEWVTKFNELVICKPLSKDTVIEHLLNWPDEASTWSLASDYGIEVEKGYWSRKHAYTLQGSTKDLLFSVAQYQRFERSTVAIQAVYKRLDEVPVEVILRLLDSSVRELNEQEKLADNMFSHYLQYVFDYLQKHSSVPDIEIARREYAYLPLIERRNKQLVIHKVMAHDADFYMSILTDVYRKSSAEKEELSDEQRVRARAGYRLLSSFKKVPGENVGDIDFDVLSEWVREVRRLAESLDRKVIGDQYIGRLLAHAPHDKQDGAWPNQKVRELIDEICSEDLDKGIRIERANMRGVYSKAMYEGGKQERALAEQYRAWARAAQNWPRTAFILKEIASGWDSDAERSDIEAKKDMMKQ